MKIIIDKERILKDFETYRAFFYKTKIPQPFISKWDNSRPSNKKALENPYIKLLLEMGYINIFRMIGLLTTDKNLQINDYPNKLNYKDFFLRWGGSETPYELTYCDFVINCFSFSNPKLKNTLDFCQQKKIMVVSLDDYYNGASK